MSRYIWKAYNGWSIFEALSKAFHFSCRLWSECMYLLSSLPFRTRRIFTHTLSVCRIDVKIALICATKPLYPAVRNVSMPHPIFSTEADLSIVGSRCLNLEGMSGPFGDELNSITSYLGDITRYTEYYRRAHNQGMCKTDFDDEQRIYIEHRILSIPFDYHQFYVGNNSIERCYRLAILLFINTVLWQGQ
jgi:hypothetical protein